MRRYRVQRTIPRVLLRAVLWLLAGLFVVVGALAGGLWLFAHESFVEQVRAHSPETIRAQAFLDLPVAGEPAVALVIGYDKRLGHDANAGSRSDTVMLIRIDPDEKTISMLSFPRDLRVPIVPCGGHSGYHGRINEAYAYCGQQGTLRTVKALAGIPINYLIAVNFHGFRTIVDKLGGVYLDVDHRYFNDNSGLSTSARYATINLAPGYQRLSGSRALDYVRFRHTDSDFYRIARQQAFMKALKQQLDGFWSIRKVPAIVSAIAANVEVGTGGGKQIDDKTLLSYARLIFELPAGGFHSVRIEGLSGAGELYAPEGAIERAVFRFMNPDAEAPERAVRAATGQKPERKAAPDAHSISIAVLNGNGVEGAAGQATDALAQRGYDVEVAGSASRFDYFRTQVIYNPKLAGAKEAAEAVALLFGEAELLRAGADAGFTQTLLVVVGATFHGTLAPAPADETPQHAAPSVVRDPEGAQTLLARAQRSLDFPLYVPTIRDLNSRLDWQVSIRVYRLSGHDAVRLIYRSGGGGYWGVQQTSWTDAPLLDEPNTSRLLKGREYQLYFNGAHLHVVAFREGDAVYWVVNTLLDDLSNETMLAIAKGLRPLDSQ